MIAIRNVRRMLAAIVASGAFFSPLSGAFFSPFCLCYGQDETIARIDEFITEYEKNSLYSGYVILAAGNEVVFQKGYGKANFEFGVSNTADTRFRIASISKAFTKIAIAKLVQDGKLGFKDSLEKYFPKFPRANEISIHQLLDHTSGIPHLNALEWYEPRGKTNISLDEIMARLKEVPLDFDPGTDRNYSNGGYAVLAGLIERVSGTDYFSFMREDILDPLNLFDTGPEKPFSVVDRLASGYKPGPRRGLIAQPRFVATAIKIGGGGFYSTPNDLLKFSRLLYQNNVLTPEIWETIFPKKKLLFLDGRRPGYFSNFIRDFENDVTVISLSNMYLGSFGFDDALLNIAIGKDTNYSGLNFLQKKYSKAEASDMVGKFTLDPIGTFVEIVRTDDGELVYSEPLTRTAFAFLPTANGSFYATQYDMFCTMTDGTYLCEPRLSDFSLQLRPATAKELREAAARMQK